MHKKLALQQLGLEDFDVTHDSWSQMLGAETGVEIIKFHAANACLILATGALNLRLFGVRCDGLKAATPEENRMEDKDRNRNGKTMDRV